MPAETQAWTLQFAVRPRVVAKYLGQACLVLSILTIVPLAVSLLEPPYTVSIRYGIVIAGLALFGGLGARLKQPERLQRNEALVISSLAFVAAPLALAYPLSAYGIAPLDALFECISGVTTTGLSTLGGIEDRPATFLFGRSWMQWTGGLGITVLALALLIAPGAASKRLGFDQRETEDLIGGTRAHARRVLVVYVALTLLGAALLWSLGASAFDGLTHSLSAISTGGFANYDDSLAGLSSESLRLGVILICAAGALPFYAFYGMHYKKLTRVLADLQLRTMLGAAIVTVTLLFGAMTLGQAGDVWTGRLAHAVLMGLSAQTTAGFASLPVSELSDASILILIVSMLVGGGQGSTAGGLKIFRALVLMRLVQLLLLRISVPRSAEASLRVGRSRVPAEETEGIVALALAYLVALGVSWAVFLAYGHDALGSLFEVTSALSTCGLSAGLSGPDLAPALKLVLCFDMLMGRVEVVAFIVLLLPRTWFGRRRAV